MSVEFLQLCRFYIFIWGNYANNHFIIINHKSQRFHYVVLREKCSMKANMILNYSFATFGHFSLLFLHLPRSEWRLVVGFELHGCAPWRAEQTETGWQVETRQDFRMFSLRERRQDGVLLLLATLSLELPLHLRRQQGQAGLVQSGPQWWALVRDNRLPRDLQGVSKNADMFRAHFQLQDEWFRWTNMDFL